jgi:multicomponent Na+:H+ antiporter subunit A
MSRAARTGFVLIPVAGLLATLALGSGEASTLVASLAWAPSLGVELAFRIDGLARLMLLLVTGVGVPVFVYAAGYMGEDPRARHLLLLLTAFLVAMAGAVAADDLFVLFIFWEMTTILSFLLVGFDHAGDTTRKAAKEILIVTGLGGLLLLAGAVLIASAAGTSRISTLIDRAPDLAGSPELVGGVLLLILGCFTKSAQFPFHFWLPGAMAAPTPVSAYLHSATMVKLGVYVLVRLDPAFGTWPLWQVLLKTVGSLTAAWGMVLALRERDLKRILAWSTVATLGTLVMLTGLGGAAAPSAVVTLLFAHALYKAPLFFVAGNIDNATGTRWLDELGGLRRRMPFTAAAALLAGISMAGIPLSFGYEAKDLISDLKRTGEILHLVEHANALFSALAVAVAGVAAVRVFWRHPGVNVTAEVREAPVALWLPPLVLATLGIALGLRPSLARGLLQEATGAIVVRGTVPALDPDPAAALGSLVLSLLAGALIYLGWDGLHRRLEEAARRIGRVGVPHAYRAALAALPRLLGALTRRIQHGGLPRHLAVQGLVATLAMAAVACLMAGGSVALRGVPPGAAGGALLVLAGCGQALRLSDRLALLLATGLVGFGSAVIFLFAGAPDLAFTQFAAETMFVVVAAAVLLRLRRAGRAGSLREGRSPSADLLAILFGAATAGLVLAGAAAGPPVELAHFFGAASLAEAHGRNVVNVILVDFRALDTLGEIAVVLFAFVAAVPLLLDARRPVEPAR